LGKDKNKIANNFSAVQEDIQNVLSPKIGIDIMAQFVVPPAIWSAASVSDRSEFNAAFLKFIIGLYSSPLKSFNNQTIEVYPSRVDWTAQKRVQINSVIHNPAAGSAADIPVSFILQKSACSWVFVDFVVDNMSGLANIQAQIQSIFKSMQSPSLSDLTQVIVKHNASSAQ
jgi:ABC-type transporter MlaC component